tara:strand:- start:3371 stop:3574 length:204 start_codon:yes stop_codon:yes gene_type:complete
MYNPKVLNSNLPNNITQMRSGGVQPPFIAGGNQTAFYLGFKGNNITSEIPRTESYSTFEKIINKHKK